MHRLTLIAIVTALAGSPFIGCEPDVNLSGLFPEPDGSIDIDVNVSGEDCDEVFKLYLDDEGLPHTIKTTYTVFRIGAAPGKHTLELSDVAENCEVAGENPRDVIVTSETTTYVTFDVTCVAVPPLHKGKGERLVSRPSKYALDRPYMLAYRVRLPGETDRIFMFARCTGDCSTPVRG